MREAGRNIMFISNLGIRLSWNNRSLMNIVSPLGREWRSRTFRIEWKMSLLILALNILGSSVGSITYHHKQTNINYAFI